jgi:hypothetical protein
LAVQKIIDIYSFLPSRFAEWVKVATYLMASLQVFFSEFFSVCRKVPANNSDEKGVERKNVLT